MYHSSRGNKLYPSSYAILKGLADDGGLFILDNLSKIDFNEEWLSYDYKKIAFKILRHFLDDFSDEEICEVIDKTYCKENFDEDIIKIKSFADHTFLELYHGPTLAFKDMALTMLPHLMDVASRKTNYAKKLVILTATSGDTGGAALSGFNKASNIETIVLYPNNGVSPFQETQMLSFTNDKAKAFAMDNNFDECQKIVKEFFLNNKDSGVKLTSANSINIGRLIPQIIYYFAGYIKMVKVSDIKFGEMINVCVPTGNFGNILASYYAKLLGLPIKDFICASNENDVLTEFFNTGIYNRKREFYKTNSPSMDILVSSNLERLIALVSQNPSYVSSLMDDLNKEGSYKVSPEIFDKLKCFKAYSATQEETVDMIKKVYDTDDYLIDPHTSVARCAFDKYEKNECKTMLVSTASPLKFGETVSKAIGIESDIYSISKAMKIQVPNSALKIINSKKNRIVLSKDEIKKYIFEEGFEINVPASSANLGCAFDVAGIALNIFNKYHFSLSNEYKCINFEEPFNDCNLNLIVKSYRYVFEKVGQKDKPITVYEMERNIPISRGLGSSSALIVAGVKAACYVLGIEDDNFIISTMIELEGHPDNVVCTYLGGFVSSYKSCDKYKWINYPVSNELKFMVLYPDFKLSTKEAREALPKNLDYSCAIHNLSRVIHLPNALMNGDIKLLNDVLDDKLHQPYRLPLITDAKTILEKAKLFGNAACISGAGSSLLIIGRDYSFIDEIKNIDKENKWTSVKCEINLNKVSVRKV